ncbi:hypothetical protein ACQP1W_02435 [Spirillospora sp. CA-255316]
MQKLTDYLLAIRTTGSPPAPEGVKTVMVEPAGDGDVIAGLRAGGLTAADFRSRVIFLAPPGSAGLVVYAALCGFSNRRIDAYTDGVVLPLSRMDRDGAAFPDAGHPAGFLVWAQVGGPVAEGIPTVHLGTGGPEPVSPEAATVIRYAARLRMVPPDSARDALTMFLLVAALRRRADDRFPFLSTGTEPVPLVKNAPGQGIDLERLRQEAVRYRQELRSARGEAEIVPPVPLSPLNRRIAEADRVDVREVLRRLGAPAGEEGVWHCPRPGGHGDRRPSMKMYGENRVRCHRCDAEKIGPVRLAVDVLGVTPDEAASFILDAGRVVGLRGA